MSRAADTRSKIDSRRSRQSAGPRSGGFSAGSQELASVAPEAALIAELAASPRGARSIRRLIDAGAMPARRVLGYQRVVGNQSVQRLLIQRKYLIPPYMDLSLHFNGTPYSNLREQIEKYKQSPKARANVKQDKLNALIQVVNGFLQGTLGTVMRGYFNTLREEIVGEQARINSESAQTSTQTPAQTPTPTPKAEPEPSPTPSLP
jgi:hypothetical protein